MHILYLLFVLPGLALAGRDLSHKPDRLPLTFRQPLVANSFRLCETAVTTAEFVGRLPPHLLTAISLTESGRIDPDSGLLRAWPWTLNAGGEGAFFPTKQEAIAAVTALQAHGTQSVDVGCMQVNLMHHPRAFASLAEAFDPARNALYAARLLNSLYGSEREWPRAIAAYHSQTPALGDAYRVLVLTRWRTPILHDAARASFVYRDFAPEHRAYDAFAPPGRVYGAFTASLADQ